MSDYENSNDKIDSFSEYFRERLINKPTPPDEKCWEEIETRLPKRRAISPAWIGLAVAASIITAVFVLNNTSNKNERPEYVEIRELEEIIADNDTPRDENILEEETGKKIENAHKEIVAETKIRRKMPNVTPVVKKDTVENAENEKELQDVIPNEKEKEELPAEIQDKEPEVKKTEDSPPAIRSADIQPKYRNRHNLIAYNSDNKRQNRRNNNWQIQAGLNSVGGNTGSFNRINDLPMSADSPNQSGEISKDSPIISFPGNELDKNYNSISNERISEKTYSIPLSVGVTVRKNLNEKVGFETGLVYSYLSTSYVVKGTQHYDAELKLHYLGVPVNLIVNLWDKKQWNFYVSGGGMVEKGLQSVLTRRAMNINSKDINSISGMQWSVNGGLGASYNFYKDMSLYVEPGISYYFDCNQPMSKRTEDSFIFNLRLGLRYDF